MNFKDLITIKKNLDLYKKMGNNILPINKGMVAFLKEYDPGITHVERWEFVKFYEGRPYFYSRSFIESHSIDELLEGFSLVSYGMDV